MSSGRIQTTGSFDAVTNEYSFTVACGELVVTFDFLKKHDIQEFISCLSCMLVDDDDLNL